MCPACIATAAWIAAGAGSAGGLTAYVFGRRRSRKGATKSEKSPPKQADAPQADRGG